MFLRRKFIYFCRGCIKNAGSCVLANSIFLRKEQSCGYEDHPMLKMNENIAFYLLLWKARNSFICTVFMKKNFDLNVATKNDRLKDMVARAAGHAEFGKRFTYYTSSHFYPNSSFRS